MDRLSCRNVSFSWPGGRGQSVEALRDITLSINHSELVSIIGPSGSGKSTLLQILAGLERSDSGEALLDGVKIEGPSPKLGMVFQDPLLFPWLSVRGNVEFGYRMKGASAGVRAEKANELLRRVGLAEWGDRFPHELSGGMKQRVAIARALITDPEVLLMDEPFAALDFQTRLVMGKFLLDVWKQFKKSIMFVTHSIDEAILLSDRVLVMSARPGRIRNEVAIPLDRPRDLTAPECNELRAVLTKSIEHEVMLSFDSVSPGICGTTKVNN